MSAPLCLPFARVSHGPASGSRPGSGLPGSCTAGSGMLQAARRVPVRSLGESEEPGKGWYMLGPALPTGRAGIGDAKRIAAVLPSRFVFIQRDSKRHVQVIKKTFSAGWGPFFHPAGLPLVSWSPMNIRGPVHPLPVRVPLLLSRGTGSSHRQRKAGKGKWQLRWGVIRSRQPVQRLEPSTGAGVPAPCSGFGVLSTDGPGLGSVSDAVTAASGSLAGSSSSAQQPREGVLWRMRKGKIPPPSQADGAINQV